MTPRMELSARLEQLQAAFERDGFEVDQAVFPDENTPHMGLLAKHRTARNRGAERKRAYYVEGNPWHMGYLMGRLAEPQIHEMAEDYIENFIRRMLPWVRGSKRSPKDWPVYNWLVRRVNDLVPPDLTSHPAITPRVEEIRGMVAGCRSANPHTEVTEKRLWALNAGVDCLFSLLYQSRLLHLLFGPKADRIRATNACNALAILNDAAEDGPLFGRDFMFPACGMLQDLAALIVYNPIHASPSGTLPIVAMSAPGFVGSISAMNSRGVAAGVNVVRAAVNDPAHLGVNSLLLVRHAVESGPTIEAAADRILDAPRGVSWLYPMAADGGDGPDRACVVEAGATPRDEAGNPVEMPSFLDYPRIELKEDAVLPSETFLTERSSSAADIRNGAIARWETYGDPCGERGYASFNERLWKRTLRSRLVWRKVEGQFGSDGRIVERHGQRRCPGGSFFAPLRGESERIVLTSNHYVCPEMRLCTMDKSTHALDRRHMDDSQWRYDTLNHLVRRARGTDPGRDEPRSAPRTIGYDEAKRLINFLEPDCATGECPHAVKRRCYHYRKYRPKACRSGRRPIAIEGAVSLFDLKRRTIDSYFGYYGDDWVKLHLTPFADKPIEGGPHDE